jgi:hypothetical protein
MFVHGKPFQLSIMQHSSILDPCVSCDYNPRSHIQKIVFSSKLCNGSYKIEWYIALGWKGSHGTNTLAYLAHF